MDRNAAGPELLNYPDDLRDAEARLTLLHPGSRDYDLMAEVVARLSADADQAVRRQVRRAALRDAAALSECRAEGYRSAYHGPVRPEYRVFLAGYVTALGGSLEDGPDGLLAVFSGHGITIRFGPAGQMPDQEAKGSEPHTETIQSVGEEEHRQEINVVLRAAFVEGAEARSRSDRGRALTGKELEQVLERYQGDVEEE